MAKLKYKHYEEVYDAYDFPRLLGVDMEENGVIYTYSLKEKKCYVSDIEEGIDEVIVADEIDVYGVGLCPVVRWGIPLVCLKNVKNVKSIKLGKNLKEYNDLTTSGLDNLERLFIPESIEQFPPFRNCNNLKELTMPEKFSMDWERFAWSHPKLQKVVLLKEGRNIEIGEREMASKRLSYQKKLDKEESIKKIEEARQKKEEQYQKHVETFIDSYIGIVCAIPYLWAIVNAFRNTVNYDVDFFDIFFQLLGTCTLSVGLFFAWVIAVGSAIYLVQRSERKILTTIFIPLLTIPFSWLVFSIALGLLTTLSACSDGFYGMVDPRFI